MVSDRSDADRVRRAAVHAALGDPHRLAVVDELAVSDRSPGELADRLSIPSNLLAHHLDVLVAAGLVVRTPSSGDARRKYVRLVREPSGVLPEPQVAAPRSMLFVCTHNSARSQLAAALWTSRTLRPAASAGTRPAARVHRGALAAARRAGVSLDGAQPSPLGPIAPGTQVVTVCDVVHEDLTPAPDWWHWSIPDPVADGSAAAFDAVVADLDARIASVVRRHDEESKA